MQEKFLFEYAVIRVVPKVEREEFLNIGVILYCAQKKFLQTKYVLDEERLNCFSPAIDIAELKEYMHALEQICLGSKEGGTIGSIDQASRLRWLTATRSTVVQTSKVHPGFCTDAKETLEKLYNDLVL